MVSPASITPATAFAVLALLPVLVSWLIVLVPSRKKEAIGIDIGNPLSTAPLAPVTAIVTRPLVHLVRCLSGSEIEGYILGLRHLPVEQTAPLLTRFVNGNDPALQLYAQGILQQGRDDLATLFHKLLGLPPQEPRTAAWLLETGLRLANPSLCGATERPGFVKYLVSLAAHRLQTCEPTPALLTNAALVFTEAGLTTEATAALALLSKDSIVAAPLLAAIRFAQHQKGLK